MLLEAIIAKAEQYPCKLVEITGGEPLLQDNVYPSMVQLCNAGYAVNWGEVIGAV